MKPCKGDGKRLLSEYGSTLASAATPQGAEPQASEEAAPQGAEPQASEEAAPVQAPEASADGNQSQNNDI